MSMSLPPPSPPSPPQVQVMLDELSGEWVAFQQCLIDSDAMLKKSKEKFKTGLIHSSEEFKKTVTTLFDDFQSKGPFNSSIGVPEVRITSTRESVGKHKGICVFAAPCDFGAIVDAILLIKPVPACPAREFGGGRQTPQF